MSQNLDSSALFEIEASAIEEVAREIEKWANEMADESDLTVPEESSTALARRLAAMLILRSHLKAQPNV